MWPGARRFITEMTETQMALQSQKGSGWFVWERIQGPTVNAGAFVAIIVGRGLTDLLPEYWDKEYTLQCVEPCWVCGKLGCTDIRGEH